MKEIFTKTLFPIAPGGNIYHFKEADTDFAILEDGKYFIQIVASAKNGKQNKSADDDDLRVSLDYYSFGKYEMHEEQISWKGFGTASSWDGASLRGCSKTIYFFVELPAGKHTLKFYADNSPKLENIQIFQLNKDEGFVLERQNPDQNVKTDSKGIPWMSFMFLGVKPKNFSITSTVHSAVQKGTTDGDNLKVVLNGKILQNKKAPASRKYKNFYFAGDLNKGKGEKLEITPQEFEFLEDSVELWYDEIPEVSISIELFDRVQLWLENSLPKKKQLQFYEDTLYGFIALFTLLKYEHSHNFLRHSLSKNPQKLIYDNNSSIARKIKRDMAYQKILLIIENQINNGNLNGQVYLGDVAKDLLVNFKKSDLNFSLHGLKKIEYIATPKEDNTYNLDITLFDVYDFDPKDYELKKTWPFVHIADVLERNLILKNFEIEIHILGSIII